MALLENRRSVSKVVVALAAAVVLYGAMGHAAQDKAVSGGTMHGIGICLLLAAVTGFAVIGFRRPPPRPRRTGVLRAPEVAWIRGPAVQARSSPIWLNRFLN